MSGNHDDRYAGTRLHEMNAAPTTGTNNRIMLAVLTVHEAVHGNPWITERWRVLGVVAGDSLGTARERRAVRSGPEAQEYLWTGLPLCLNVSEADSYYYNLIGDNPSVYVFGHRDDDGEFVPIQVSIEYIDAMAHGESGNEVCAVPMPPDIYRHVEEFVLEHFVPEEPRQRRKRDEGRRGGGQREPND
ncbi:MAG TPA: DUF3305 domain-containing protein [Candidatus Methylomirabilis sp.]|nr:DUF3305 domain-containing protein [Candidatus Methylomirabilis sp.]